MTISELRQNSVEAILKQYQETSQHLRDLHSQLSAHQLTNFHEIRKMRKQIARIFTVLNEKKSS